MPPRRGSYLVTETALGREVTLCCSRREPSWLLPGQPYPMSRSRLSPARMTPTGALVKLNESAGVLDQRQQASCGPSPAGCSHRCLPRAGVGAVAAPTQFPGTICLCGATGGDYYGLGSSVWTFRSLQSSREPTPTLSPSQSIWSEGDILSLFAA